MKKTFTFRQSDLEQADKCLESLRLKYSEPIEQPYTSDLARGNAVHNAIEYAGNEMIRSGEVPSWDEVKPIIDEAMLIECKLVKDWRTSPEETEETIQNNFEAWYWEVFPHLSPIAVEKEFNVLLDETKDRKIHLSGTIDWIDESGLILDWKNPTRPYQRWEKVRWDNQSTVYTYAVACSDGNFEERPFQLVMLCKGKVHTIDITRGPRDWEALKSKCHALADLIDANLNSYPQGWNSWYCSPKWCAHWSQCRGAHLGDDPQW